MTEVYERDDGWLLVPEADPPEGSPNGGLSAVDPGSAAGRAWMAWLEEQNLKPQKIGVLLAVAEHEGHRYVIASSGPWSEKGEGGLPARYWVWFDLYRFEDLDPNSVATHDYLQDTFDDAKERAQWQFGVPADQWRRASRADERTYPLPPGC